MKQHVSNVSCKMEQQRPKLGWINQKSCFNKLQQESHETTDQNHLKGVSPSERLGHMFDTGLYSDCSFSVEGTEIRTHKLILAAASPKMERMFLGPDASNTDLVEVPYTLRIMQLILKHVYLQDMDIENIVETQDVIEAAEYFEMKDLVELCCAGIEPQTLDDFWPALDLACRCSSRTLKEACLSLALKHSSLLLGHEGFKSVSPEALAFLLSRDVIEVNSELEVIEMTVDWAENRAEHNGEVENNLRPQLDQCGILRQLRILSLPKQEFVDFITGLGKKIFTEVELDKLEYNYFSDTCETYTSPIRTERMLECRVPICGTDYLAVNADKDHLEVNVKVYGSEVGIRPIIKTIIIPSQINPANILYDNVSHRTHYNEYILVEVTVNDKVTARGSFFDRIKYSDDVMISLNTFNYAPMYIQTSHAEEEDDEVYYEAKIKIIFKNHGYYPLAVETKCDEDAPIVLTEHCRFVHEFVLTSPKI